MDFSSQEMKNFSIFRFWAFLQIFQLVQADLISLNRYYNTLDGHNSGMMDSLVGGGVTKTPTSTPNRQLLHRYIQFELSNMKQQLMPLFETTATQSLSLPLIEFSNNTV